MNNGEDCSTTGHPLFPFSLILFLSFSFSPVLHPSPPLPPTTSLTHTDSRKFEARIEKMWWAHLSLFHSLSPPSLFLSSLSLSLSPPCLSFSLFYSLSPPSLFHSISLLPLSFRS